MSMTPHVTLLGRRPVGTTTGAGCVARRRRRRPAGPRRRQRLEAALAPRRGAPARLTYARILICTVDVGRARRRPARRAHRAPRASSRHAAPRSWSSLGARARSLVASPGPLADPAPAIHPHQPHRRNARMTIDTTCPLRRPAARALRRRASTCPATPGTTPPALPWNVAVDQRPAAVAIPHSAEEVAEVVRAAAAAGLRVAPQSTGHGAGARRAPTFDDVVILRLSELTGVTVDPDRPHRPGRRRHALAGRRRRRRGARAGRAARQLRPTWRSPATRSAAGSSFYARRHGLAANSVAAVEIVTADGSLVRADATPTPICSGRSAAAAATSASWSRSRSGCCRSPTSLPGCCCGTASARPRWSGPGRRGRATSPESVTTSLRVMSFPPLPELPPFLSGRRARRRRRRGAGDRRARGRAARPAPGAGAGDGHVRADAAACRHPVHMDPPGPAPAVTDTTCWPS